MPIDTYNDLKSAVADWLADDGLTAVIPQFIALAEAQIGRQVRHYKMMKRQTATLDDKYLSVPSDWIETLRIHLQTTPPQNLRLVPAEEALAASATGRPTKYAHIGEFFQVSPAPDQSYTAELFYYRTIPALSDTAQSNWLLTEAPDVYLYGALTQSAPYLVEDARVATWGQLYSGAVNDLNRASRRAMGSNDTLSA